MIAGTPPAVFQETPARQTTPTPKEHTTPEQTTPLQIALRWKAVDIDSFFEKENLPTIAALTDAEKQMTIQQFLTNEAKRQEDELRTRMHKQIAMVDAEFNRALATIDEL
jgi:hypothetical protein